MKREEICMGLVVSALCMGASSFAVRSQSGNLAYYQQAYSQTEASSQAAIESLPDGNYRFCCNAAPSDSTESGMCFRFQKTGDRVVGNYQPANSAQASICIAGRINRNTINGEATDFSSPTSELLQLRPELEGGDLVVWDAANNTDHLKVSSGQALDREKADRPAADRVGSIHFRQAALDLSNFYQYSAGAIEPPTQCGGRGE